MIVEEDKTKGVGRTVVVEVGICKRTHQWQKSKDSNAPFVTVTKRGGDVTGMDDAPDETASQDRD